MRKFILGFIGGMAVATVTPAAAAALVGDTGYLFGWTVTVNGNEVCDSPYVWTFSREIECG